jgi:hypothetical protein
LVTPLILRDREPLALPEDAPPLLTVVVDTEEEFDWNAPFSRSSTSVESLAELGRFQEVCEEHKVSPTYVCDWPVITSELGRSTIGSYLERGKCQLGAHLHPWVNPPHDEELSSHNSYPGNLAPDLEREKLEQLTSAITERFGLEPRVYRAGRYGLGPRTAEALEALGYVVDVSPLAGFDLSADGGPDWSSLSAAPYRFGPTKALIGFPATGGFSGWLNAGAKLHSALHKPLPSALRLQGILSRIGAFERIMLSPEGYTLSHMKSLTRALIARGVQVFQLSLHSPSMLPGCTDYARDPQERDALLARCADYLRWFREDVKGEMSALTELPQLLSSTPPSKP